MLARCVRCPAFVGVPGLACLLALAAHPALWEEQFEELPAEGTYFAWSDDWDWEITDGDALLFKGRSNQGLTLRLAEPDAPWSARNTKTEVRFQFIEGEIGFFIHARFGESSCIMEVRPDTVALFFEGPDEDGESHLTLIERVPHETSLGEWHLATFEAQGRRLTARIGDAVVCEVRVPEVSSGYGALGMYGTGQAAFDHVVITRG